MIELINVTKKYGMNLVIDGINLTFKEGTSTKISGDNGSGKSVLLRLIVGYALPTSGEIRVDGGIMKKDFDFIQNAGVLINSPEFLDHQTGMENLKFLASFRKVADEKSIQKLADQLYFGEDIHKKYKLFSLGMRQKMRIIQALMDKPSILILDEPLDNLDKKSKAVVVELLNDFMKDKSRTLIYVSHNDESEIVTDNYIALDS